ncbi:MAG: LacI family transcriptional regulator [Actinomycetota bacterium]|nr:LacI family transcriptional regulator [Actinomycetota bacterium]
MADVASLAEVSIKTVSRVVNDEPGVRSETASRVRAVIDELGFHRHEGASMLRKGHSTSIGLIVEDLANPWYSQLAAAMEREARGRGHFLISTSAEGSPAREAELVSALFARRVEGLVVVPASGVASAEIIAAAAEIPVVCVDRPLPGLSADTVLSDNEGGVRSAVEHLVAHRHERIGFLGDDAAVWTAHERLAAFCSSLEALGLAVPTRTRLGPYAPGEVSDLLTEWSLGPEGITAVMTSNNRVTLQVISAVRERGLDLVVIGYDDFELADFLDPPVTCVHQDPASLGERAIQQLFSRLDGERGEPRTVVIPTRLIVRSVPRRPAGRL